MRERKTEYNNILLSFSLVLKRRVLISRVRYGTLFTHFALNTHGE